MTDQTPSRSPAVSEAATSMKEDIIGQLQRAGISSGADLSDAVLSDVPAIPNIDAAILGAIEAGGKLRMDAWHTCKTTHCRAGWAITLAGKEGLELEKRIGSAAAGALIYLKSAPDEPIPNFYASHGDAMADIKARAAKQLAASGATHD